MRLHEREQRVRIAQTQLEIALTEFQWPKDDSKEIDDVEMLRLVTLDIREILLDMDPKVERAERFTHLKELFTQFKTEQVDPRDPEKKLIALTDVELLQALFSYCSSKMKYMLRYERHGNYEDPGGLE